MQGEPVEGRGDCHPGQLRGGQVGVVDPQQAAGGEGVQGVGEHSQVVGLVSGCSVFEGVRSG